MHLHKKLYKRYSIIAMRLSLFVVILLYCLPGMLGITTGFSSLHKSFAHELTGHTVNRAALGDYKHKHIQGTRHTLFHAHTTTDPDAQMSTTVVGDSTYNVGDSVTYNLDVSTSIDGGEVSAQTPLTITDQVPAGFNNLTVSGTDWSLNLDNTTSPATMTATYTGATPILPGTTLSSITLTGTLTDQAVGSLTNTATLALQGDSNSTNDASSAIIQVAPSSLLTPTPEPTSTSSPIAEPTSSPTGPDLTVMLGTDATGCTNIGDQVTYTATVTNEADADVVGTGQPLAVTISLPDGLSDVTPSGGSDWQTSINGTIVLASYTGSYPVAAGTSLTPITITATMQTPSSMNPVSSATVTTSQDTDNSNNMDSNALTICAPNLDIIAIHQDADAFQVGQPIVYTLRMSDDMTGGPVIAGQAITVTDAVPLSVSQVTPTGNGWKFTTATSSTATTVTATYTGHYPILTGVSLPDITIGGVLTGAAVPTVINSATVSTPLDSNLSDNMSSDTVDVAPVPDLALGLTHAGTTCISARQDVVWRLSVTNGTNAGPVLNGPVTVIDTLPVGLSNIRANGSGWSITSSGTVVTATYAGDYPVDPGAQLSPITVKGNILAAGGTTLLNTAKASTPDDSNVSNDTVSDSVTVCRLPAVPSDLGIRLTHVRARCVNIGDQVTYMVMVTNGKAGPVLVGQPITVIVTLPAGLSNITPDGGSNWRLTMNGTTVTANYSGSYPVKPGSTLGPIMITATIQTLSSSNPVGYATVITLQDSNLANNTARDVLTVCPPILLISKTHQGSRPFHVGQPIIYTIAVNNKFTAGPVMAGQSIKVIAKILHGLKQIKVTGSGWQFTMTSSPMGTTMSATYNGQYPVIAGAQLPPMTISGTLTAATLPVMTISSIIKTSSGGSNIKNMPRTHFSFVESDASTHIGIN